MGALFAKPKTPEIKEPAPIPDVDSPAIQQAETREIQLQRRRRGLASTILTSRPGSAGLEYARTLLG